MNHFFIATLIFFILTNVLVEWLRRVPDNFQQEPLSAFLVGKYGWIQSLGYLVFALGLAWLGYTTGIWPYYVASVALALVVATA